jgi:DNA-directed RNA polymerase alpha subunit
MIEEYLHTCHDECIEYPSCPGYRMYKELENIAEYQEVFPTKAKNALFASNIIYVDDLLNLSILELWKIPGIGERSVQKIHQFLYDMKLKIKDHGRY